MKRIFLGLTIVLLMVASMASHGEIYSWVDKEGKKHFGEKVPKEYLNKSTQLEVKAVNTMDAAKSAPRSRSVPKTAAEQEQERRFLQSGPDPEPIQNLSNCERQKKAYEESIACYSSCKNKNMHHVNNVANCSHCVDLKKPSCN